MALYDDLPLNTPTKISEDVNAEIWATRTQNGGTVETRVKPGTDLARGQQLEDRAVQALAANTTFLAIASPSNAQIIAQTKALTRQVSAIIRLRLGRFESVD
jgi:predicted deacylase